MIDDSTVLILSGECERLSRRCRNSDPRSIDVDDANKLHLLSMLFGHVAIAHNSDNGDDVERHRAQAQSLLELAAAAVSWYMAEKERMR